MKVLVLGGEGMLGHKMFQTLTARFPGAACTIRTSLKEVPKGGRDLFKAGEVVEHVNAMDLSRLEDVLRERRPDFLVNCIGIVKQGSEAESPLPCIMLNALMPHKLVELASEWGGRVIHVSTDCVFSGRKGSYREGDVSDADDLYGRTKYLGETASPNALTLRTSIIGRELSRFRSLLEWFLSQRGGAVRGYKRVIYSGVTTNYLATVVGKVIEEHPSLHGLFHVASAPISKHDLLHLVRNAFGLHIEIIPDEAEVSDRSLIGTKFLTATGLECPPWPVLIGQLVADPTPYDQWRD
jgi:dTDP-4-dehydrorhamnose reductase